MGIVNFGEGLKRKGNRTERVIEKIYPHKLERCRESGCWCGHGCLFNERERRVFAPSLCVSVYSPQTVSRVTTVMKKKCHGILKHGKII